jgi:hypothetical protein
MAFDVSSGLKLSMEIASVLILCFLAFQAVAPFQRLGTRFRLPFALCFRKVIFCPTYTGKATKQLLSGNKAQTICIVSARNSPAPSLPLFADRDLSIGAFFLGSEFE